MSEFIDLTGQRFGLLTVIKRQQNDKHGTAKWLCKCDCGKTKSVSSSNLLKGHTKSCGCLLKSKISDLADKRFGKLVVIERTKNNSRGDTMWLCKCDCGNESIVTGRSLKSGATKSCGCGSKEALSNGWGSNKTHGMTNTRLYRIWCGIKKRTEPSADERHKRDYYNRGIKMCEEWKSSFKAFYDWAINNGYSDKLTIDRKNNGGNYCPENCRWATNKEQSNNRRSNIMIEFNGKTQNLTQWCVELNLEYEIIRERIKRYGWSAERALTTPIK